MENIPSTVGDSEAKATARRTAQKPGDRETEQGAQVSQPLSASSTALQPSSNNGQSSTPTPPQACRKRAWSSPPSTDEETRAAKRAKDEAADKRRLEKLKRKHRAFVSKKVGHEVNTDEEREYDKAEKERADRWFAEFDAKWKAEEARREALSPEERRNEDVVGAAKRFRDSIFPRLRIDDSRSWCCLHYYPRFVLQEAPMSPNGARCCSGLCEDRVLPGQYRICVTSGIWGADMYHVKCFEELLLSSARYVIRFEPNRDHHFPDRGAQDILAEYISRWRSRIEQASKALNKPVKPKYVVSASNLHFQLDSNNELGPEAELSPALKEVKTPNVWAIADEIWERRRQILAEHFEEDNKIFDRSDKENDEHDLANAAEGDDRSWHITKYLLDEDNPDYNERYALSQALERWTVDKRLARSNPEKLNEADREAREALGGLTIRRIQRHAMIHPFSPWRRFF